MHIIYVCTYVDALYVRGIHAYILTDCDHFASYD